MSGPARFESETKAYNNSFVVVDGEEEKGSGRKTSNVLRLPLSKSNIFTEEKNYKLFFILSKVLFHHCGQEFPSMN